MIPARLKSKMECIEKERKGKERKGKERKEKKRKEKNEPIRLTASATHTNKQLFYNDKDPSLLCRRMVLSVREAAYIFVSLIPRRLNTHIPDKIKLLHYQVKQRIHYLQ